MSIGDRIVNDEPSTVDSLGRKQLVHALADVAETCQTPLVVGLYGGWGTGKTTLMRLTEQELGTRGRVVTVWFDPWQHQFDENPAIALLHTMVDELNMGESARKLLATIASAFGGFLLKNFLSIDAANIRDAGERYEEERFMVRERQVRLRQHFQELLRKATGNGEVRLVFFIDDLDRCGPVEVMKVLEALKLYLNMPDCVYILGVDRQALQASVKTKYSGSEVSDTDYLDKIVQMPLTVPSATLEETERFVAQLLPQEPQLLTKNLARSIGSNPRQIKRFANAFVFNSSVAVAAFPDEHDPRCLAAVLLMQLRTPELYKAVSLDPDVAYKLADGKLDSLPESTIAEGNSEREVVAAIAELLSGRTAMLHRYMRLSQFAGASNVNYAVTLEAPGSQKIAVIKVIREVLPAIGLKEAKDLVDGAPSLLVDGLSRDHVDKIVRSLEAAGARVSVT